MANTRPVCVASQSDMRFMLNHIQAGPCKFRLAMQDDWELGDAGHISYLDAIAELADFRKEHRRSERSIGNGVEGPVYGRDVFKKGVQNHVQDDEIAVDQRTRY